MCYDSVKSCVKNQDLGVIQDLKLGPFFFNICSCDFAKMCSRDENILYADDTVLVYVGISLGELTAHINNRLRIILKMCR